jgi:hypothetical protein
MPARQAVAPINPPAQSKTTHGHQKSSEKEELPKAADDPVKRPIRQFKFNYEVF